MKNCVYTCCLFLLTLVVFAYSGDDVEPVEQEKPDTSKTTYAVTCKVGLRSGGEYDSADEMMKTLILFFVNSDNKIEKKVELTLPTTKQSIEFEVQLLSGVKSVYGFSNLSAAAISSAGLDALEGSTMPDLTNTTIGISNGFVINSIAGEYLPLSNKTTFSVLKAPDQSFSMEMIRMVCKLKFTFQNETGHSIALKNVTLGPITTSSVYLLPRSDGQTAPPLPAGFSTGNYTYTFPGSPSFVDGSELTDYFLYINESKTVNNEFIKLTLNTLRGGSTDEVRMSVTNLTYLNRNDYLPLNIILTDYRLELVVRSYAPIGGYPASVASAADGYHCVFPGGGSFVIQPKLIKISDGSVVSGVIWSFSNTDATPTIFDKAPVLKNGEILGTINATSTGSALGIISANVTTSLSISRAISYKVFISQN